MSAMKRLLRRIVHPTPATGPCPACVTAQSFGHVPHCGRVG